MSLPVSGPGPALGPGHRTPGGAVLSRGGTAGRDALHVLRALAAAQGLEERRDGDGLRLSLQLGAETVEARYDPTAPGRGVRFSVDLGPLPGEPALAQRVLERILDINHGFGRRFACQIGPQEEGAGQGAGTGLGSGAGGGAARVALLSALGPETPRTRGDIRTAPTYRLSG